jgi:hypothetical protein
MPPSAKASRSGDGKVQTKHRTLDRISARPRPAKKDLIIGARALCECVRSPRCSEAVTAGEQKCPPIARSRPRSEVPMFHILRCVRLAALGKWKSGRRRSRHPNDVLYRGSGYRTSSTCRFQKTRPCNPARGLPKRSRYPLNHSDDNAQRACCTGETFRAGGVSYEWMSKNSPLKPTIPLAFGCSEFYENSGTTQSIMPGPRNALFEGHLRLGMFSYPCQ